MTAVAAQALPPWRRAVRKATVFVLGTGVLASGVALVVLPGPSTLIILVGLAILATEFSWAQRWLGATRRLIRRLPRLRTSRPLHDVVPASGRAK